MDKWICLDSRLKHQVPNENTNMSTEQTHTEDNMQVINTIENTKHNYKFIDSDKEVEQLIQELLNQKSVCFDTETSGLDKQNTELLGIAFSYKEGTGCYVSIPEKHEDALKRVALFKPVFQNDKIEKIAHNFQI